MKNELLNIDDVMCAGFLSPYMCVVFYLGFIMWDCQPTGVVYGDGCDVCKVPQSLHVCRSMWCYVWASWCGIASLRVYCMEMDVMCAGCVSPWICVAVCGALSGHHVLGWLA